jgi:diketogulonate reductase-like aldo/keto reductase
MADIPAKILNNDIEIPLIGLGTWKIKGREVSEVIPRAIDMGYRHIDTAEMYGNEEEIGSAIKGFDRETLFITSKVTAQHLEYQQILEACKKSLSSLKTDYLDLYLIHWPNSSIDMEKPMEAFQKLYEDKKILSFGISNFTIRHIKNILPISEKLNLPVTVNQIEFHPLLYEKQLAEFCNANRIAVTAYCPLARGKVLDEPTIKEIAGQKEKSPAQVALRWSFQKGNIIIPKASSRKHLAENLDIFGFALSQEDMDKIDGIGKNERVVARLWD